ncbi:MAG: hypothetical protein NT005_08740, partial [Spirochaetes bacterium]|nr:hypothetical protein [Spirochaetota bacterium]
MTSLSLMGLPRNMMGLEAYSLALYDERDLVEEIADHMLWWNTEIAKKVFAAGIVPDFLRSNGVPVIFVDCDG